MAWWLEATVDIRRSFPTGQVCPVLTWSWSFWAAILEGYVLLWMPVFPRSCSILLVQPIKWLNLCSNRNKMKPTQSFYLSPSIKKVVVCLPATTHIATSLFCRKLGNKRLPEKCLRASQCARLLNSQGHQSSLHVVVQSTVQNSAHTWFRLSPALPQPEKHSHR